MLSDPFFDTLGSTLALEGFETETHLQDNIGTLVAESSTSSSLLPDLTAAPAGGSMTVNLSR